MIYLSLLLTGPVVGPGAPNHRSKEALVMTREEFNEALSQIKPQFPFGSLMPVITVTKILVREVILAEQVEVLPGNDDYAKEIAWPFCGVNPSDRMMWTERRWCNSA
jgi:hypothetical protein